MAFGVANRKVLKMEIKVFGLGHVKSKLTDENIRQVLFEERIHANVEKVTGWRKIGTYGIYLTPSVSVDGTIKCVGRIPNKEEIRDWINGAKREK
jgi:small redox-active disulfide protein 2